MYEAREETTATGWGISVLQDMKFLPLYAFLNCLPQCHDMESNEETKRGETLCSSRPHVRSRLHLPSTPQPRVAASV